MTTNDVSTTSLRTASAVRSGTVPAHFLGRPAQRYIERYRRTPSTASRPLTA